MRKGSFDEKVSERSGGVFFFKRESERDANAKRVEKGPGNRGKEREREKGKRHEGRLKR